MTIRITEGLWQQASQSCSLQDIIDASGLAKEDLLELIDMGIIEPSNRDTEHYSFQIGCVTVARTARRLRDDFDLDRSGMTVALRLLGRIDELEAELNHLRTRLGSRGAKGT